MYIYIYTLYVLISIYLMYFMYYWYQENSLRLVMKSSVLATLLLTILIRFSKEKFLLQLQYI